MAERAVKRALQQIWLVLVLAFHSRSLPHQLYWLCSTERGLRLCSASAAVSVVAIGCTMEAIQVD